MLSDYMVEVIKREKETGRKILWCQSLVDYCKEQRSNLTFLIGDLEKFFIQKFGEKSGWDEETTNAFLNARRTLLNEANSFDRLPYSIRRNGAKISSIPADKFTADTLNMLMNK